MKKLLPILTTLALLISLAACTDAPAGSPSATPTSTPTSIPSATPTSTPTPEPSPTANSTPVDVTLTFNLDGWDAEEIPVRYTENNGHRAVDIARLATTINGDVSPVGDSNKYVIGYKHSLYMVDMDQLVITTLLNNQSGQYRWNEIKEQGCTWGDYPLVSQDGTKMAFMTTRNGVYDPNGEWSWINYTRPVWVKDLVTGAENLVYPSAVSTMWWAGDTLFVEDPDDNGFSKIVKIGEPNETVLDYIITARLDSPYIYYVSQSSFTTMRAYNIQTGETISSQIMAEAHAILSVDAIDEDGWAIFTYSPTDITQFPRQAKFNALTGEVVLMS
ncbi:hypothetical protein FACS1894217_02250 [Clostridia bacterium]|nr:hypothetical protein FACS1894217_02250 [Clostridia bacterium]